MRRAIFALGLALTLAACGGGSEDAAPDVAAIAPTKDALVKSTENGPVKATVTVWPARPALGDAIYLRLTVESPAGISVDAPFQEAGDQRMGRFKVVGFTRTAAGSGAGSGAQEILTEEVPLDVAPVADAAVAAELKGARGELDPDVGGVPWIYIVGGVSLLAILVAGGLLLFRAAIARRRIALQRNAYDDAVTRLRQLESRGAPPADEADGWFVELSAIVRAYVEQRYRIRAPELTTEEFLQVAVAAAGMADAQRALLVEFLERCDRVKFAGYRPDADESIATLKAARGFVEDTRLAETAAREAA